MKRLRPAPRALHGVDQVIGDLDTVECLREPVGGERITARHLDVAVASGALQREAHTLGVAAERADAMSAAGQLGDQQRADEATGACDENAHMSR